MQKIEVLKPFKEFEIGGEVFTLDLSLEASKERDKVWTAVADEVAAIQETPNEIMNIDKLMELYEKGIDTTFGEGSFKKLFAICGESLYVFNDLINKLKGEFDNLRKF